MDSKTWFTLFVVFLESEDSQKLEPSLLTLLQSCELEFFRFQFPPKQHLFHPYSWLPPSLTESISESKCTRTRDISNIKENACIINTTHISFQQNKYIPQVLPTTESVLDASVTQLLRYINDVSPQDRSLLS